MTGSISMGPSTGTECDGEADGIEQSDLLEILDDPSCRAILRAVHDGPRTVRELSEACGLTSSTTYRKVEALHDVGLVEERIRLRPGGNHARAYECCFQGTVLTVTEEGAIVVEIGRSDRGDGDEDDVSTAPSPT